MQKVRSDIENDCFSDLDLIEYIDERPIEIFYLEDYALAHINNKTGAAQGYLQQSYILTYQIIEEHWQKKSVTPYNYNIQLLSKDLGIFLSENLYCSMGGDCTSYVEFSKFGDGDMVELISYSGYDRYLYIFGLFSRGEDDKALSFKGDTVTNNIKVRDYTISEQGLESFELERETRIFKSWDNEEELITDDSRTTTVIELE